jgi:hypothetical protein
MIKSKNIFEVSKTLEYFIRFYRNQRLFIFLTSNSDSPNMKRHNKLEIIKFKRRDTYD